MQASQDWFERWMAGRRRVVERALREVCVAPGGVLIDVAAGDTGLTSFVADRLLLRPIAEDFGAREARFARADAGAAVRGDVRHLPFRDHAADVTVAFEIIEHFSEWEAAQIVDELHRVTKPGGTLLLSTPNRYSLESFKGIVRFLRDGTVWNGRDETHLRLYSRRDLTQALARRFDVREVFGYYLIERGSRPLPGTYAITSNPLLANLCFLLVAVATARE